MSIIDKTRLSEFSSQLWEKIKIKMKPFLNKNEDSFVSGKVTFKDAYVQGGKLRELINPKAIHIMGNNTSFFVSKGLTIPRNTTLSQVTIAVGDNKRIGDIITGVNIGFVKASNREVLEYFMRNGTAIVIQNTEASIPSQKVITIPVDKTFTEDVYLLIGANGAKWGDRDNSLGGGAFGGGTLPNVGSTIQFSPHGNYIGQVIMYGENLSINSLFDTTNRVDSVNNQRPTNGNITLNASHLPDIYSKQEADNRYYTKSDSDNRYYTKTDANNRLYSSSSEQINDANDFKVSGIARTKGDTRNLPSDADNKFGVIQFFRENSSYGVQIWYAVTGNARGQIWTRGLHSNTWSSWEKIATNEDISNFQTDLKYTESVEGGNLFNKDKLERGKFIAFEGGGLSTNSGWGIFWSDFYIKAGDKFIINQVDPTYSYYVWFVDKENKRFDRVNLVNGVFTVPESPADRKITGFTVNVRISDGSEDTFMLYRGDTLPPSYQPFGGGDYILFPHKGFKFGFNNEGRIELGDDLQTAVLALANKVIPPIVGELKTLIYDAGEQFEDNERVWLRCDGQTVPSSLLDGGINLLPMKSKTITLPSSENGIYKYVCIK